MARPFRTEMGGPDGGFEETNWSEIFMVQQGDAAQQRSALGTITRQYWKPVYCYLLRKGFDNEQSKDLTQGFFTDVILGRRLVQKADAGRGRFRSFLLTAVSNYVNDYIRKQGAVSRSPEKGLISLEGLDLAGVIAQGNQETPEEAFHREWASALLEEVLEEVEQHCRGNGQEIHWRVFCARVLAPIADNVKPQPYADICEKLGIDTADRATTMNVTVKRQFESALRRHIRRLVDSDDQVEQEIGELMTILSYPQPGND